MKSFLLNSVTFLAAVSLMAADKDEVASAAQKLVAADNYSWTITMTAAKAQTVLGPNHGKIQKDGLLWLQFTQQTTNTLEAFSKSGKAALKTEEGWQAQNLSTPAPRTGRNLASLMGFRLRNFEAPSAQAVDLVSKTKTLTKAGEAYTGELTEEGAKSLMTPSNSGRRAAAPAVSNAKGSVTFWLKDGVITKYEFKVSGKVSARGQDRDVDRSTTVEIKDVGTTKITVPDEVKSKLS